MTFFMNGLSLPLIRHRLLENTTLSLEQAYTQAVSLDLAQKNGSYVQPIAHVATVTPFSAPTTKHIHILKNQKHLLSLLCIPIGTALSVVELPTLDSNVQLVNQCVIIVRLKDISVESAGLKRNAFMLDNRERTKIKNNKFKGGD